MNRRPLSTIAKRAALMSAIILPVAIQSLQFGICADWRDSKALREELGRVVAEAEAIAQIAMNEKRELSDDEVKRVDAILGVGEEGKDGFKAGIVHDLKARIARMEKIESARDSIASSLGGGQRQTPPAQTDSHVSGGSEGDSVFSRIVVPAACQRPALKAHVIHGSRAENYKAAYAMGMFFLATVVDHEPAKQWCSEHGLIKGSMTIGTPADGGYLVPSELATTVEYWRDLHGVFRGEASYERMTSDTKDVPVQIGGLPYFFVAESTAITATGKLAFKNVELVAKKVATIARMSSELSEDAVIDIGEAVVMAIGEAFALAEDNCGFLGDGTSGMGSMSGIIPLIDVATPLKGLYVPAGISTLEGLTNAHMRKIISMIPGKYRMGCKWYCNSTVYDAVMAPILDAAGGNTQSDLEQGPGRLRFKGYDVRETQVLPDAESIAAEDNVLIFGNLRAGAKFGDRRMLTISRSDQVYWVSDDIGIKGTQRFQAKIHEQGTVSAVGAFVVLQLAAAGGGGGG